MESLIANTPTALQNIFSLLLASKLAKIVLILIIMFISQRIIDLITNKFFQRAYESKIKNSKINIEKKRFDTLAKAFRQIASVIIWIIGLSIILSTLGLNLGPLLAGVGVLGVAIGIAGKDIIMDLYVGMMVLLEDQYRVGDVITIDQDHSGTVEDITLRTVKLRDIDGAIHVVPHSLARSIINKTYDYSNVNVEIGVSYDSDIETIKSIIYQIGTEMAEDKEMKNYFIEPIKYQTLLRFDESQITVRAQGKVIPGKQWAVASDFRLRLKKAFDMNGIDIPFPQRVVHQINQDISKKKKTKK